MAPRPVWPPGTRAHGSAPGPGRVRRRRLAATWPRDRPSAIVVQVRPRLPGSRRRLEGRSRGSGPRLVAERRRVAEEELEHLARGDDEAGFGGAVVHLEWDGARQGQPCRTASGGDAGASGREERLGAALLNPRREGGRRDRALHALDASHEHVRTRRPMSCPRVSGESAAASVTATSPRAVRKTVRRTRVPATSARVVSKSSVGRIDQCPAAGSRRRANTDGASKRSGHHQSIDPARSTSAADWQSDRRP